MATSAWTAAWLPLLLQGQPAAAPYPPPPIVTVPLEQRLVVWRPGEVRCDGAAVAVSALRRPAPELRHLVPSAPLDATFAFAIDAHGRPHSIARSGPPGFAIGADLAPSLAASRFPAGAAHVRCAVTYSATGTSIAAADIADLVEYSIRQATGRLPREAWDRIAGSGNCFSPSRPQALVRVSPDHRAVPGTPGHIEWSALAFDIATAGAPTGIRVAHGTGNPAVERAAVEALSQWRFAEGERRGCLMPFARSAQNLPAPYQPTPSSNQQAAACGSDDRWLTPPRPTYPEAYRRRGIEGWARVTYDVAPWGQIGNVAVVEAQPSDDFGRQALSILRLARTKPSDQGATGCTELVRFVMEAEGKETAEPGEREAP
ncbi:MAG: TonB family protein [Cypionkella sp.]